ncbi:hypothetical protein ABEF91_007521 [Exophiala dermatitidis]
MSQSSLNMEDSCLALKSDHDHDDNNYTNDERDPTIPLPHRLPVLLPSLAHSQRVKTAKTDSYHYTTTTLHYTTFSS